MKKYRFKDDHSERRFGTLVEVAFRLEVLLFCLFSFLFITGGLRR